MTFRAVLIAAIFIVVPGVSMAVGEAESEDGDYSIEAIGSARLTGAYLHFPDIPEIYPYGDDGLAGAVLRMILEGDLGPYMDYEVNFFADLSRVPATSLGGTFATAGSTESTYRYRYLSWGYWEDGAINGRLGLDRFALNLNVEPVTASAGRMPINYSVTNIFTPNDFFAPFSATAINTVYKPGVDALRVAVTTGMLSSVEIVGVMGYRDNNEVPSWYQSALLARAATVLWNFEWALIGGKLAERWVVGAGVQGEAGPVGLRTEGHVGFPDREESDVLPDDRDDQVHGRVAAGLDVLFNWQNASLSAEYMFVSDGASGSSGYGNRLLRFFPDDLFYLAEHYVGLSAGMDLIPILRANVLGLLNTQDLSGLAAATLVYNIADEADFVGGVMIPWGEKPSVVSEEPDLQIELESEFGAMPLMVFLETRFYF